MIIKSSKINYITIVPNAQLLLSLDGVFCNKKNADDIFNTLRELYPNGHFYEVEEEDDIYSHYKYKEFLHPMDQD